MIFATPWLLLALAILPVLWWLLRVTPPAPRTENFPAIRLLLGLNAGEETPARTPWWLLLLRLFAAALLVVGLAQPILDAGGSLPGDGPVLLVLDDGWAASGDWQNRLRAADEVLSRAERAGRKIALLTTTDDETGGAPAVTAAMPAPDLRPRLAALHPKSWPSDRMAAAGALAQFHPAGAASVYISDGLADGLAERGDAGQGDAEFGRALAAIGPVEELRPDPPQLTVMLPPRSEADRLVARIAAIPERLPRQGAVLAQSGDARTLARAEFTLAAGSASTEAQLLLPPELRNRLERLVLEGPASAGGVALLDERWRRRPVGLLAPEGSADAPLTGSLYYLRRALAPFVELREGNLASLLARDISVIVLADQPLVPGEQDSAALTSWVERGGLLIRFAGPRMAEADAGQGNGIDPAGADPLLPVHLLAGDRQLGGALSWSHPEALAPFPPGSPFAGLPIPPDVAISRQVLAEPSAELGNRSWALLGDGTPLVTETARGAGRIVLFHVTGNADWSNLPLSGLFVEMLRRLVQLSVGVASVSDATQLAPATTLDGFGALGTPPPAATPVAANAIGTTTPSAHHPPGFYGPENGRRALNLGATLPELRAAPAIPGASVAALGAVSRERALGPWLLGAALALLGLDMLLALRLRGLLGALRPAAIVLALGCALAGPAHAADAEQAALHTRLAFVQTGDDQVDQVSRAGLAGLSAYVNARTAAALAAPDAVLPGTDDLSVYPLLYWPMTADTAPSGQAITALNDFMRNGGIVLIDTRGGDGGSFAPGAASALQRAARGLDVPPLAPLTNDHVLARAFYLLSDFPGRYTGDPVWVQRDQDRTNDSVSPVIIGNNDWAAAWAVDPSGRNPYAVIPGGDRQRTLAYRFGVNLVMYALTGNYKGDQVHVPAILERLGQ